MDDLPVCRWREIRVDGGLLCHSQKFIAAPNRVTPEFCDRQTKLFEAFGLPIRPLTEWGVDEMIDAMRRDKKSLAGKLRFVLPTRLGHVELVEGVEEAAVRAVLSASVG